MMLKKVNDVLQDEVSECGLACISYIASVFGVTLPLTSLRNKYEVTLEGLSFYHLMKIFADHNFIGSGVSLSVDELSELKKPAILLWNNSHFVVLKEVAKNYITVMDPAVGSRRFTWPEVTQYFSGMALEVVASDSIENKKEQQYLSEQDNENHKKEQENNFFSPKNFYRGLIVYKSYTIPLILLGIIIQFCNIGAPKFMSLVYDDVLPKNDEELLFLLLYIFSFVYLIQALAGYLKILISQRLRRTISFEEGSKTIDKVFRMNLSYFKKRLPADLIRKTKAVDVFHIIFTQGWIDITIQAIFALVFMALMFFIDEKLTFITLGILALMTIVRMILLPSLLSRQYASIDAEVRRDHHLFESIDDISAIKVSRNEYRKVNTWISYHTELEMCRSSIERTNSFITLMMTTVSHVQTLAIIGLGAYAVLQGENTAGNLIAFIFYKNCLIDNVQAVIEQHVNLKLSAVEIKRLKDLIPPANDKNEDFKTKVSNKVEVVKKLDVQKLTVGYSNLDMPVIQNISFCLNANDKLVITGPSGCGKTTILNTLAGLISPLSGSILVNDLSLDRFGMKAYQGQVAMVSQDDKLLAGTVLENIIYESDNYDPEHLDACIEKANFSAAIKSLYSGLNTRLGQNGTKLSSGQHQRLMIARALYKKPKIILLDEPTSHLDKKSKDSIIELIRSLDIMCIIVSHDDDLIKHFNLRLELAPAVNDES